MLYDSLGNSNVLTVGSTDPVSAYKASFMLALAILTIFCRETDLSEIYVGIDVVFVVFDCRSVNLEDCSFGHALDKVYG